MNHPQKSRQRCFRVFSFYMQKRLLLQGWIRPLLYRWHRAPLSMCPRCALNHLFHDSIRFLCRTIPPSWSWCPPLLRLYAHGLCECLKYSRHLPDSRIHLSQSLPGLCISARIPVPALWQNIWKHSFQTSLSWAYSCTKILLCLYLTKYSPPYSYDYYI